MKFPELSNVTRLERLQPPQGKVRLVIDTDTYNEIDDQFAIVYALTSQDKFSIEGMYAAPFYNWRSESAGHGMELSFEEILRLFKKLDVPLEKLAFRGSDGFLESLKKPIRSDAVDHLIKLAMGSEEPLYIAALGALTNIASAILFEPKIIERIVVVWMGGHAFHWPNTTEFNLRGDLLASQLVFNCGVPLVQIPAKGVTSHLRTTVVELEQNVKGRGLIGDFLFQRFSEYEKLESGGSKEIWDIVAIAYLINSDWMPSYITSSPMVAMQPPEKEPGPNPYPKEKYILTYSFDHSRHPIRYAYYVERDPIFNDMFRKLDKLAKGELKIAA
jgi:purine nucleosidase